MKQYVIDQLRPEDHDRIQAYLKKNHSLGIMEDVFALVLKPDQLSEIQAAHKGCAPFYLAMELEPDRLSCELLVRAHKRVRCDCIAYATPAQRDLLIDFTDRMLEELGISV